MGLWSINCFLITDAPENAEGLFIPVTIQGYDGEGTSGKHNSSRIIKHFYRKHYKIIYRKQDQQTL